MASQLILKTSHTTVIKHRNQVGTERKLPLCSLVFIMPKGATELSSREQSDRSYPPDLDQLIRKADSEVIVS